MFVCFSSTIILCYLSCNSITSNLIESSLAIGTNLLISISYKDIQLFLFNKSQNISEYFKFKSYHYFVRNFLLQQNFFQSKMTSWKYWSQPHTYTLLTKCIVKNNLARAAVKHNKTKKSTENIKNIKANITEKKNDRNANF